MRRSGESRTITIASTALALCACTREPDSRSAQPRSDPPPVAKSAEGPLESLLARRRSVRDMDPAAWLTQREVRALLWAAQGMRPDRTGRTAPSAGALYPLELYLVALRVRDLAPGLYRYVPDTAELSVVRTDLRLDAFLQAAMRQPPVQRAAAVVVLTGVWARTTGKYGDRGRNYVWMEAGHASQNLLLRATELGLATTPVGAFLQEPMDAWLGIDGTNETALYLNCVGR